MNDAPARKSLNGAALLIGALAVSAAIYYSISNSSGSLNERTDPQAVDSPDAPKGEALDSAVTEAHSSVVTPSQDPLPIIEETPPKTSRDAASPQDWDYLISTAKDGNAISLDAIERAVKPCVDVPFSPAAREARIEATLNSESDTIEGRFRSAERLRIRFLECDAIPRQVHDAYRKVLWSLAAEIGTATERYEYALNGYPKDPSQLDYTDDMNNYRIRARQFLADGVSAGDPEALLAMVHAYRRSHIYSPDPARAYVYAYAHALATGDMNEAVTRRLANMERGLIQTTIPALRQEAETISHCCT